MAKDKKSRPDPKKVLVILLIAAAFILMSYPFISNWIFEHTAGSVVASLNEAASGEDKENAVEMERQAEAARYYNSQLASVRVQLSDPFNEEIVEGEDGEYSSLLNMTDTGIMGYIEIPVIDVSLPIYHGTGADVLEQGIGHLEGTSLPVGGESSHCVLTGHTGLSSARMFTDLTELEKGDIFLLHVMGEQLAYEVDQIKVVEATDLDDLYIEKGKDLCTLVTCTPYGINSHRLLVRGERTDYEEASKEAEAAPVKTEGSSWLREYKQALFISFSGFAAGISILLTGRYIKRKRR